MMNNLLVLFMVLYAMSVLDLEKFESLSKQMGNTLGQKPIVVIEPGTEEPDEEQQLEIPDADIIETPDDTNPFDEVYEQLQEKITEYGYTDLISLEKGKGYLNFRFGDNALFYPDSAVMKEENKQILKDIGDILLSIDNITQTIEIGGHTATVNQGATASFFSWELSADRAIEVLKFLAETCNMPQSKMMIAGYSKYHPVADNENETTRQMNRRVEIKITHINAANAAP